MAAKEIWEGECRGGPMGGQIGQSRFPKGFLLVDKARERAWVYDWQPASKVFVVRDPAGDTLDTADRLRAAEESTYDVRAWSE